MLSLRYATLPCAAIAAAAVTIAALIDARFALRHALSITLPCQPESAMLRR